MRLQKLCIALLGVILLTGSGLVAEAAENINGKVTYATIDEDYDNAQSAAVKNNLKYDMGEGFVRLYFNADEYKVMLDYVKNLILSGVAQADIIPFERSGGDSCIILRGDNGELKKVVKILGNLKKTQIPYTLVNVAVNLRRVSFDDTKDTGIAWGIGLSGNYNITGSNVFDNVNRQYTTPRTQTNKWDLTGKAIANAKFSQGKSDSEVLTSGEVTTPNGKKVSLTNTDNTVVIAIGNNSYSLNRQAINTSITVIPTIIHYVPDKPEDSDVRLEIAVDMSVVSGYETVGNTSYPIYATKKMITRRVVKADNNMVVAGIFVSDNLINSRSGLPFFSDLPIVGGLFSSNETVKQYSMAVLTLSTRLIPVLQTEVKND